MINYDPQDGKSQDLASGCPELGPGKVVLSQIFNLVVPELSSPVTWE